MDVRTTNAAICNFHSHFMRSTISILDINEVGQLESRFVDLRIGHIVQSNVTSVMETKSLHGSIESTVCYFFADSGLTLKFPSTL